MANIMEVVSFDVFLMCSAYWISLINNHQLFMVICNVGFIIVYDIIWRNTFKCSPLVVTVPLRIVINNSSWYFGSLWDRIYGWHSENPYGQFLLGRLSTNCIILLWWQSKWSFTNFCISILFKANSKSFKAATFSATATLLLSGGQACIQYAEALVHILSSTYAVFFGIL